jgi:hypothetical protein
MKQKRATTTRWQQINPVLAEAELGIETDTGKAKLGDGVTTWNSLPYWVPDGAGSGPTVEVINNLTSTDTDKALSAAQGKALNDGKLALAGGTMTGVLTTKTGTDYDVAQARNIRASTADLAAGSSTLASGQIYLVYE